MPSPTDPFASALESGPPVDAPGGEGLAYADEAGAEGEVPVREGEITTEDGGVIEATEAERREPSAEETAEVQDWWARTDNVTGYTDAAAQYEIDNADILLRNACADRDDASIETNLIYLNSRQTVAMMVPSDHRASWEPTPDVDLVEGDSFDPANPQDLALRDAKTKWDVERKGFAQCLNKLVPTLASEAKVQEHFEAWAQDGSHHQTACLSVFWQDFEDPKPSATVTTNDSTRTQDDVRRMGSEIAAHAVQDHGATANRLARETETLATEEAFVRRGLYFENKPLVDWRIDDCITGFEDREKATWWSYDAFLTDDEILQQFDGVSKADLQSPTTPAYSVAPGGGSGGDAAAVIGWRRHPGLIYSADGMPYFATEDSRRGERAQVYTRRVREIWDAIARERLVLVEGLSGYALVEPFPQELNGQFPMELLCFNRRHRSVYGLSDTQLQAPTQRRINTLRTDEEAARDASKPRWGVDAARVNGKTGEMILNLSTIKPGALIALDISAEDMQKAVYPLFNSNSFNPINYDGAKLEQEMRKSAALPEQALGVTGSAEFATEVQVAAQGANVATRHRQQRMERAMQTVYDLCARYVAFNLQPEDAAETVGPLALRYWPADPKRRMQLYDSLAVTVEVAFNAEAEDVQKLDSLTRFLQVAQAAGGPVDPGIIGRLAARILGEEDLEDAINPDPTAAARILAQAIANGGPAALPPEAQEALASVIQSAMTDPATLEAVASQTLAEETQNESP